MIFENIILVLAGRLTALVTGRAKELMKNATDGTYLGIEIAPKFFSAYVLGKMEGARSTS